VKILSQETNLGIGTTVSSATVVRAYNSAASVGIVTRKDSGGTDIGSLTIPSGEVLYLEKKFNDTLVAPSTVLASKVAYSHMMYYACGHGSYGGGSGLITDNLLLHLDASNYSSGTWNDESGEGNNGTLVNGASYSSDNSGVINFDGSNDYISFASLSLPNRPFTVSTWCKFDDLNSWQMVAGQDQNQDSNPLGAFYFGKATDGNTGDSRVSNSFGGSIYDGTNQINCLTPNAISANTWYNFVTVFSGSDIKTYMNDSLETTTSNSSSIATRTGTFRIGGAYFNNNFTDHLDGKIGVFSMYNSALSASDVTQNFNAFKSRYGYTTGLITNGLTMHYDAENYSGSGTWQDESTNSNHGTISGATFQSDSPKRFNSTLAGKITTNATINTSTYTKAVWFRPETSGYNNLISTVSDVGSVLWMNNSNNKIAAGHKQTGGWDDIEYTKPSGNFLNAWWYVVVTFDSSSGWVMYVNGSQVQTSNSVTTAESNDVQLLQYYTYDNTGLDGDIAMASIYDRVLTSTEVFNNWYTFKSRYGY